MKHLLLIVFSLGQLVDLSAGQELRTTITSPKPTKGITPDTYSGRQILVGSGGGFTGFTTTYYLLENGQLFRRRSRDSTFTFVARQSTAQTKRLFSTVENTCKIKKTKFDHPGNRYTFVQWRKGKQNYRVFWGMPGYTVPTTYPKFVDSFMAMIPTAVKQK